MHCPHCQSQQVVKNGKHHHQDGTAIQNYLCKGCRKRFSERTGTPMARLRTPASIVSLALKMRTEGMGMRASGRVLEKSHVSIMRWEQRLANQQQQWSPPYLKVQASPSKGMRFTLVWARTFPPSESKGWTVIFIERDSRYWSVAQAGFKDTALFTEATQFAWQWARSSAFIRWFTDGERRYAQQLWRLASVYLKSSEVGREHGHRQVWREGLEVAIKVKGSQGHRRVEWVKPEHPYTAISPAYEVHANHVEANNSALRRR